MVSAGFLPTVKSSDHTNIFNGNVVAGSYRIIALAVRVTWYT